MPELPRRGVFLAALAVPIALVTAPLTASAEEPDDVVITEQLVAGGVATPEATAAMASATTTTAIEESDEFDEGDDHWYGPGPDWAVQPYSPDSEDTIAYVDEDVTEESTEEVAEETSAEAVAVVPVHEEHVVGTDDDVVEWSGDGWAGAAYEDVAAHAGADGAWVTSTEAGAVSVDDGGYPGSDTAAWYEDVTAAAGSDGAFVESTESAAFETDGWLHGYHTGFHDGFHDDVEGAAYEHEAAAAGVDGAWVENIESAAFELD